ncbi:hypothetical protein B0H14DRAFT_2592427 [Mycena olivaceomarginata]|nr:hypothetical protein B0H14DRAFT_2592427 [Mycena olivaceomarginata]
MPAGGAEEGRGAAAATGGTVTAASSRRARTARLSREGLGERARFRLVRVVEGEGLPGGLDPLQSAADVIEAGAERVGGCNHPVAVVAKGLDEHVICNGEARRCWVISAVWNNHRLLNRTIALSI